VSLNSNISTKTNRCEEKNSQFIPNSIKDQLEENSIDVHEEETKSLTPSLF
jgi:hypothetical protein